ncbi:hypothetical protein Tco_0962171 [Tanacetum coccineum]
MEPGRCPTVNRNPLVNRLTNRNNVDINSGIDTQMLNQLIATRVAEAKPAAFGTNLTAYNQRFQELILLCPEMVPNADRLLERYIEGLPLSIKGNVTSSKPVDLHEAIGMAQGLMYQVVQELGENSGAFGLDHCRNYHMMDHVKGGKVEGEISYNVHKLNESKTADGYERRLWQKANLEYVKKSSIIKQDTSTLRNLQSGLNKLRY